VSDLHSVFYLTAGLVGGCSTLPSLVNRPALTTIFNTGATRLGRLISPLVELILEGPVFTRCQMRVIPLPHGRYWSKRRNGVGAGIENPVDSRISATFTNYACRMTGSFIGSSNGKEKSCVMTLSLAPTFGSVPPPVRVAITDRVAIVILSR